MTAISAIGMAANTHMAGPDVGESTSEADRCVNTNRPLTRSLDLTEEGLAMQATRRDIHRFWVKVAKAGPDDCWLFTAALDKDGYGTFYLNGAMRRAPRVSWIIAHPGEQIPDGQVVRHGCDNPPCVNPAHLMLGTHQDNDDDRVQRDRSAKGDRNGARLHPDRLARGEASPHYRSGGGCVHGHPAERSYRLSTSGGWRCRDCRQIQQRAWRRDRRHARDAKKAAR